MANIEDPVTAPVPVVDIADGADDTMKKTQHMSGEGADAKKDRSVWFKPYLTQWVLTASCIVIALVLTDMLLLGSPDDVDARTSWFPEAWQFWTFLSSDNVYFLEFAFACPILACVLFQLSRQNSTSGKGTKGIMKKLKHKGRRDEAHTATVRKPASSNASPAKLAEYRNQQIRSKWNVEIAAAVRQDDIGKATRLIRKFETEGEDGCKPDVVSYNFLIHACAKKGDFRGAEKWLQQLESKGFKGTNCSYNLVLDACAKAGTWIAAEACEQWLQRMLDKGVATNVVSYASVVHAWARRGEQARAEMWMKRMIDSGIEPDEVAYNSMIHACSVCGNPAGAEWWMQDMQDRGIEASVTTFATVIDACAKGGDLPSAEKWFEKMLDAKIEPSVVTFTAMIDACAKKADPDRAEYWLNRMVQCNIVPNAYSFSALITAFAKAKKDASRAEEWLEHAETLGLQDGVIYSSALAACSHARDSERASKIFQRMVNNGIEPSVVTYSALARPFSYLGDWVEVERIATEMYQNNVRSNEYFLYAQLIAYATSNPRQDERAEQCFREALRSGLKANDQVVMALCRAVGRTRCTDLMQELCNGRSVPACPQTKLNRAPQNARGSIPSASKAGLNTQPSTAGGSYEHPWRQNY